MEGVSTPQVFLRPSIYPQGTHFKPVETPCFRDGYELRDIFQIWGHSVQKRHNEKVMKKDNQKVNFLW